MLESVLKKPSAAVIGSRQGEKMVDVLKLIRVSRTIVIGLEETTLLCCAV